LDGKRESREKEKGAKEESAGAVLKKLFSSFKRVGGK
jgi:hypothetical protein